MAKRIEFLVFRANSNIHQIVSLVDQYSCFFSMWLYERNDPTVSVFTHSVLLFSTSFTSELILSPVSQVSF